jgi:hypothetical protein
MVRKDYSQLRRSDGAFPDVCHPFRYELAADQNPGVLDAGGTRSRLLLELLADDVVAAGEHTLRSPCVDPETRFAFIRSETFTGPKRLAPRLEPEDVREQVIPSQGSPVASLETRPSQIDWTVTITASSGAKTAIPTKKPSIPSTASKPGDSNALTLALSKWPFNGRAELGS